MHLMKIHRLMQTHINKSSALSCTSLLRLGPIWRIRLPTSLKSTRILPRPTWLLQSKLFDTSKRPKSENCSIPGGLLYNSTVIRTPPMRTVSTHGEHHQTPLKPIFENKFSTTTVSDAPNTSCDSPRPGASTLTVPEPHLSICGCRRRKHQFSAVFTPHLRGNQNFNPLKPSPNQLQSSRNSDRRLLRPFYN